MISIDLRRPSIRERIWRDRWIYVFLLPTILLVGGFTIYPVAASIWFSLLDWNGFERAGEYIGFANYAELVNDPLFWNAFRNTMVFMVLAVPLRVGIALLLAIALNQALPLVRVFRTAIFLPVVTTAAIIGVVMRYVLDPASGPLNIALLSSGVIDRPLNFLGQSGLALYSAVGVWVWKWLGITLIYWLAALQTIPRDALEAATIDGANAWDRFLHITLPLLTPFTIIITLITVVDATNIFDLMLTLTGGGPFYGTEVIDIFVYRQAFLSSVPRLGYSSAAAIFFGACFIVLAIAQVAVVTRLRRGRVAE